MLTATPNNTTAAAGAGSITIKNYTTTTTDAKRRRIDDLVSATASAICDDRLGELAVNVKPQIAPPNAPAKRSYLRQLQLQENKSPYVPFKLATPSSGTQLIEQSMPFLGAIGSDSEATPSTSKKPPTMPSNRSNDNPRKSKRCKLFDKKWLLMKASSKEKATPDLQKSVRWTNDHVTSIEVERWDNKNPRYSEQWSIYSAEVNLIEVSSILQLPHLCYVSMYIFLFKYVSIVTCLCLLPQTTVACLYRKRHLLSPDLRKRFEPLSGTSHHLNIALNVAPTLFELTKFYKACKDDLGKEFKRCRKKKRYMKSGWAHCMCELKTKERKALFKDLEELAVVESDDPVSSSPTSEDLSPKICHVIEVSTKSCT